MCSRYEFNGTFEEVVLRFDISAGAAALPEFSAIAEVRPTNRVPVITSDNTIAPLRWGLKVDWDTKPIINARSETLAEKRTFQPLLENRCLVPATAYFEWRKDGKLKIKTRIQPNQGALVAFAGLVDDDTFTIITCAPSPSIAYIHGRMPVILDQAAEAAWLSSDNKYEDVAHLLTSYPDDKLETEEVAKPPAKPKKQGDLFS
jgi:putative SOS response-associated peptidase YedK